MLMISAAVLMLVACASNPPVDNDPARAKAHAAYDAADQQMEEEASSTINGELP